MNRSERRKSERKYGQNFTMQKYRDEAIEEGRKQTIELALTMTLYTIDYVLELSEEKLQEVAKRIMDNIDSYRTGQLTPSDYDTIKQELKEKGIII